MSKTSTPRPPRDPHGVSSIPDLGGRSVVDLITGFFGLMLDPDVGNSATTRFAVRAQLTVLDGLGVPANAVRMALSRQVQRGMLVPEKIGGALTYALSDKCMQTIGQGGVRVRSEDPFASTFTVWTLASFSVPEKRRELRNRLRTHLNRCGFRPLRDGLWVALNSFAADLATQDLDADLADHCELAIFIATPYGGSVLTDLVRGGWDVDDMRTRHERFLARWEHHLGDSQRPLSAMTLFVADWVDLLQHDPGLPQEVVGADWPAHRSIATASRLFATMASPAAAALAELLATTNPRRPTVGDC